MGSEMCIRDRPWSIKILAANGRSAGNGPRVSVAVKWVEYPITALVSAPRVNVWMHAHHEIDAPLAALMPNIAEMNIHAPMRMPRVFCHATCAAALFFTVLIVQFLAA